MKGFKLAGLFAASLLASSAVLAADSNNGFFVGGFVGQSSVDLEGDSESAANLGAYGGYNFNDWFGVEATLFRTRVLEEELGVEFKASGFTTAAKFSAPVNEIVSIYGKVGLAHLVLETSSDYASMDFDGNGFLLGAGVDVAATENLHVRLGYDYMSSSIDVFNESLDMKVSQLNLGVHYQF